MNEQWWLWDGLKGKNCVKGARAHLLHFLWVSPRAQRKKKREKGEGMGDGRLRDQTLCKRKTFIHSIKDMLHVTVRLRGKT
jgi:hypothetical protein